jgi:preprotein translocase subunit SecA
MTADQYRRREIEYPVEFAMNMAYGRQGPNAYSFGALAEWANAKYGASLTAEQICAAKPAAVRRQLLELSESLHDGGLAEELDAKIAGLEPAELAEWASRRFDTPVTAEQLGLGDQVRESLLENGRQFLRKELGDLEKYVLLQIYDGAWKDHLYAMDHLRDSIWTRSFAERDPKTEYKREGFRMFNGMLDTIEDRVTDVIFKVRLDSAAGPRSVWQVSKTAHDQISQFAISQQQRAAAAAGPAAPVKTIKLEQPKVGRNDPCPCGSGKKYKKCCGAGG